MWDLTIPGDNDHDFYVLVNVASGSLSVLVHNAGGTCDIYAYLWDVSVTFRNAPPVVFEGLDVGDGGDLLTLLAAQGWQSAA